MNKRLFIWILVLMGISLPGIVMVLFYWLNNPMKMNKAIFDRQVIEVLNDVAKQIQVNQDTRIINNGLTQDTVKQSVSISGGKNHSRINQAVPGLNNAQKRRLQMLQGMTQRYKSDYKDWVANPHIDLQKLKATIKKELTDNDIPLEFHWAIFSGDSILERDFKNKVRPEWHKVNILPDDIFNRDLYLGIYFPVREEFIYRHRSIIPGLSIVITLIVFIIYILCVLSIMRQKKLSAMKTDFINNMTHEFKTPITTIGIAADSILKEDTFKDEERIRFFSNMIIKENQRLNDNVERILQAARFERKELYFRFQDVKVHDLIIEAIQGISVQVEKRGGRIVTKLEAKNQVIQTDPIHFTNMVHNLLDNANKYSPESPDITVSTVSDNKGLYLSVEDKGIGISKKVQTKIFEKFYRLTYGNLDNIKGFGLGLSYIKTILKLSNGSIKVYSEPGKGSRFVIFIPFKI